MSKLPDFEGLAMFAKVAEERSFAAAARAMGVSVATVSPVYPMAIRAFRSRREAISMRRVIIANTIQPP